jgi:catalase
MIENVYSKLGEEPDYARRDLFDAITNKTYPSWTLKIQVITQEDVEKFEFNPFDATKVCFESL